MFHDVKHYYWSYVIPPEDRRRAANCRLIGGTDLFGESPKKESAVKNGAEAFDPDSSHLMTSGGENQLHCKTHCNEILAMF